MRERKEIPIHIRKSMGDKRKRDEDIRTGRLREGENGERGKK